jgi:hypothetical protein
VLVKDCIVPVHRLALAPQGSEPGVDPEKYPPGSSSIEKRARRICRRLKAAADPATRHVEYDLDRDLRGLRTDVTSYLTVVRAAAGVLIIVGLLITLFNLRGAVGNLQQTFRSPIENASEKKDERSSFGQENKVIDTKTVREGMQGIAGAAKTAFQLSAVVISLAAALLVLAFVASQFAASRVQRFEWWAEDLYHKALEQAAARRPEDVVHNLSATVVHLANLTRTFETTNSALQELKSFGEKMDNAAQQITFAVANLPGNIGASMSSISTEVAQGINQDLRHQVEYLKGILTIYSDQHNVLKKIMDFIESVSKSQKSSSDSLLALQSLPLQIQAVAQNVKLAADTGAVMHSATKLLERKIDALPMEELNGASKELRASLANIGTIEHTLTDFKQQFVALMAASGTEATNQIKSALDKAVSEIAATKHSITAASETTVSRLGTLATQIKTDLNQQSRNIMPAELIERLDEIVSEVRQITLNPFRALFGRRDGIADSTRR